MSLVPYTIHLNAAEVQSLDRFANHLLHGNRNPDSRVYITSDEKAVILQINRQVLNPPSFDPTA